MREIKFRGQRIFDSEWIYGNLIISQRHHDNKHYETTEYYISNKCYQNGDLVGDEHKIDPETVGQYTGLKDKNGVEIYEGDIVHCWGGEFCQGYWEHNQKTVIKNMIGDCFMMREFEFLEMIGNIHENHELMEGGQANE